MDQTTYDGLSDREKTIALLGLRDKAALDEKVEKCWTCKQGAYLAYDDIARLPGHLYSKDGVAEFRITHTCEFCFDKIMREPTEPEQAAHAIIQGQVIMRLSRFDSDYTEEGGDGREVVAELSDANVVTSVVAPEPRSDPEFFQDWSQATHKPILDIDLPVVVLPSSTPGHHHLYIDKAMTWEQYFDILTALATAGVIEEGYLNAAERRLHTAVRLPWVKKVADRPAEPENDPLNTASL